ncbi:hypothetical protein HRM2_24520 [Desulforapulum autotrophicum HRM2]|uniref:CULT domain-containing protein n=1 Tax=Desulforapulum autotrophicum (strain ATCC 43914 / DSM 3382 / VKM B-1955 / HRM2) TaxID=177437 RepID=C0QFX8_DESAH|nr:hypothetical protein HRM2_24520 [Desulforapulum autotrophicum HRM2]
MRLICNIYYNHLFRLISIKKEWGDGVLCFRDNQIDQGVVHLALDKNKPQAASREAVLCSFCYNAVTDTDNCIAVNGSHAHIFANPHGYVYEIACYKRADGCVALPVPSVEFSWFKGYYWQVAICKTCSSHLGWFFQSNESSFFGLIQKYLIG